MREERMRDREFILFFEIGNIFDVIYKNLGGYKIYIIQMSQK